MKDWRIVFIAIHLLVVCTSPSSLAKSDKFETGKMLFMTNCSPCHGIGKEKLGPSLASITKKRSHDWLVSFISNSQSVILSGDPYAQHLFERYNRTVMPAFPKLSAPEITSILEYINSESIHPSHDHYYDRKLDDTDKSTSSLTPEGSVLFTQHCSQCHSLEQEKYGPALASVTKRHPKEWLIGFIQNSGTVIKKGDGYASYIYKEFDEKRMPQFNYLDTATIVSILKYIEYESASPSYIAGANGRKNDTFYKKYPGVFKEIKNIKRKPSADLNVFPIVFTAIAFVGSMVLFALVLIRFYKYLQNDSE